MGIDVDPDGRVLDRAGRPQPRLLALGPICRGTRWETTAVPELRQQAERVAQVLQA